MKKTILLAYTNIAYPIFVVTNKPYRIQYEASKIYCQMRQDSTRLLVDDKTLPGDYFNRLVLMKNRIQFDYTCKNLQYLLFTKPSWGIDRNAVPHDFSKKHRAPAENRLVTKFTGNLIWLKNISYPFEIPTKENISINDNLYATIVYVNGEWYLKGFTLDKELKVPYIYV